MLSTYNTSYYSVNNKVSELTPVEDDCKCGVSKGEQKQESHWFRLVHYYHICETFQKALFS